MEFFFVFLPVQCHAWAFIRQRVLGKAMAEKLLYRPSEAAQSLGMSRTKVYGLMQAGELGSVKVGSSRRIPAADLDAFVRRLRDENAGYTPGSARQGRERVLA
jgi:excisionase family DNA binding protein